MKEGSKVKLKEGFFINLSDLLWGIINHIDIPRRDVIYTVSWGPGIQGCSCNDPDCSAKQMSIELEGMNGRYSPHGFDELEPPAEEVELSELIVEDLIEEPIGA